MESQNACWQRALSRALHMEVRELKRICKPFVVEGGALLSEVIDALMRANNYEKMDVDYRVEEVMNFMDSKHNELVIATEEHIFYVNNDTVYDNVTDYNKVYFLNEVAEAVYYRVKGEMA